MSFLLQIANVSSGAGSLAGKVKFVEDAETRKNLPYATQAMAYKMSKAALNMREHHLSPTACTACWLLPPQSALRWSCKAAGTCSNSHGECNAVQAQCYAFLYKAGV